MFPSTHPCCLGVACSSGLCNRPQLVSAECAIGRGDGGLIASLATAELLIPAVGLEALGI